MNICKLQNGNFNDSVLPGSTSGFHFCVDFCFSYLNDAVSVPCGALEKFTPANCAAQTSGLSIATGAVVILVASSLYMNAIFERVYDTLTSIVFLILAVTSAALDIGLLVGAPCKLTNQTYVQLAMFAVLDFLFFLWLSIEACIKRECCSKRKNDVEEELEDLKRKSTELSSRGATISASASASVNTTLPFSV